MPEKDNSDWEQEWDGQGQDLAQCWAHICKGGKKGLTSAQQGMVSPQTPWGSVTI